jgi:hypothetical protein
MKMMTKMMIMMMMMMMIRAFSARRRSPRPKSLAADAHLRAKAAPGGVGAGRP